MTLIKVSFISLLFRCPDSSFLTHLFQVIKLENEGGSWKEWIPSRDQVESCAIETLKVAVKGIAVGLCVGVISERFRHLMCQGSYRDAARCLLQSAGLGGALSSLGHAVRKVIEKIGKKFGANLCGWKGVAILATLFEVYSLLSSNDLIVAVTHLSFFKIVFLIFKFNEKGLCWGFARDLLGSASRIILVTVVCEYFSSSCFFSPSFPPLLLSLNLPTFSCFLFCNSSNSANHHWNQIYLVHSK